MLVPDENAGDQNAGIHGHGHRGSSLAPTDLFQGVSHLIGRHFGNLFLVHGDEKAATALQPHRAGLRFELDPTVAKPHGEPGAGCPMRFLTNPLGNDNPACPVDGRNHPAFHGTNHTMRSVFSWMVTAQVRRAACITLWVQSVIVWYAA